MTRLSTSHFLRLLFIAGLQTPAILALEMPGMSRESSGGSQSILVTTPWIFNLDQVSVRAEYNLFNEATIGAEFIQQNEAETDYSSSSGNFQRKILRTGEEANLSVSRYSTPSKMAGFYWTLGAGYRMMRLSAFYQDPARYLVMNETAYTLTDDGYYQADLIAKGNSGHARLGYRYRQDDLGLNIGGYAGIQYFQRELQNKNNSTDFALTRSEREKINQILRTNFAMAAEVGLSF